MTTVAVVTGGTKGIGRRVSEMLLERDCTVVATFKSDQQGADDFARHAGNTAIVRQVNGRCEEEVKQLQSEIAASIGPCQILINNAGVTNDGLFSSVSADSFLDTLMTNFGSVIHFSKAFLPEMIRTRQGDIVNIGSVAGTKAKVGNLAYGCSKVAVERFTAGLSIELARFNVRVNCVAPGYVDTQMFERYAGSKRDEIIQKIPGRRILNPDEIAKTIVAFALRDISTTGTIARVGNGENAL